MKAVLRKIRISPKKANLVAGMVRGRKVKEALDILKFTPKKGARILYKVVQSAAANAKNNFGQSIEDLVITKILVTKGPTLKRSLPTARGRSHPILKRMSHITVEVGAADVNIHSANARNAKTVPPKEEQNAGDEPLREKSAVKTDARPSAKKKTGAGKTAPKKAHAASAGAKLKKTAEKHI